MAKLAVGTSQPAQLASLMPDPTHSSKASEVRAACQSGAVTPRCHDD